MKKFLLLITLSLSSISFAYSQDSTKTVTGEILSIEEIDIE